MKVERKQSPDVSRWRLQLVASLYWPLLSVPRSGCPPGKPPGD